jgi:hypothetical protein
VRSAALLPIAALALISCRSIGSIVGAGAGIATGSGTSNPVVGYAVAVGTKAAVDALVQYIARERQQGEQDEIAAAVGALGLGETAPWHIEHTIPVGNEHGDVTVVRLIDTKLAACKEVVFSVIDGDKPDSPRARYATTACRQDAQWKWAQAEPATERWGYLQ